MSKYVVLGVESASYVAKSGNEVNLCTMYYFDSGFKSDSRLEKGFRILTKNVYPDFSLSDFSSLPGYYDLDFKPVRGRRGKLEPSLSNLEFKEVFKVPQNGDNVLILSAKKYDYQPEPNKTVKGVKFFFIDPHGYEESSDFVGFPLLEASFDKSNLDIFSSVPGFYHIDYEQVRGRNGDSLLRVGLVKFVSVSQTSLPVAV